MADNSNRIVVNLTTNNVVVNNTDNNQLTVVQPVTDIIQVNSPGPQGAIGPSAPFTNISTNIWATTSSLQVTSSINISGSIILNNLLTILPTHPLPSGVATGSFAVSSSVPPKPYFFDGTSWNVLY